MSSPSPISAGFGIAFRRPSLPLAEIAWRWSFAASAWFLAAIFLIAYANSLPVNALDRAMWHSGQPALVGRALRHILAGSGFRFTTTAVLLVLSLTVGWMVLSSLGRAAIVRSAAGELGVSVEAKGSAISSLLFLNFLRVAAALATIAAVAGSVLLASSLWASTHAPVALGGRLIGVFWFLIWICWAFLNWLLSFTSVFAPVHEGLAAAFATAADLLFRKTGALSLIFAVFGICHVAAFIAVCGAGFVELGLLATVPAPAVVVLAVLTVLVYCAVADFLYTARVVAYLSLLRPEEPQASEQRLDTVHPVESGSIDKGELILSDAPAPAI